MPSLRRVIFSLTKVWKLKWLDPAIAVISGAHGEGEYGWTAKDLSAYLPSDAEIVILELILSPVIIGTGNLCSLEVRPSGWSWGEAPKCLIDKNAVIPGGYCTDIFQMPCVDGKIDHYESVSAGWTIGYVVNLFGYGVFE